MPFGGYFDAYYRDVIRPAVSATGLRAVRADEIYSTGVIVNDIYREIASAELCIADVSGRNPNVSYELGMAHARGKPVIIITQDIKDVPFDYRHIRIISYDPKDVGWDRPFARRIQNTITEIRKQPAAHLALAAIIDNAQKLPQHDEVHKLQEHVRKMFYAGSYDLDRTNWIYASEDGTASIKTSWRLEARSQIFHLCHNIVLDKPGVIEVLSVRDKIEARDLNWVVNSRDSTHLSYFILLKQFKEIGQHCELLTDVTAQNYFDFDLLFQVGESMMSTQAVEGGIRYVRRVDNLFLPKTPKFSRIYAQYQSHPNKSLIGTKVNSEVDGDFYIIKMAYDVGAPYQMGTAAFLRAG